jgi:hypothetical protein
MKRAASVARLDLPKGACLVLASTHEYAGVYAAGPGDSVEVSSASTQPLMVNAPWKGKMCLPARLSWERGVALNSVGIL